MAKYYIRPRKVDDPKKWLGPFDASELKEQAERRLFSKELHEYSEDRLNWISARQIWPTLFPKTAKPINSPTQAGSATAQPMAPLQERNANDRSSQSKSTVPAEENHEWYCACDGTQHGPFTLSQLRELVVRGQLQPTDLIWQPALGDQWVEAQSNPALFRNTTPKIIANIASVHSFHDSSEPSRLATFSFVFGLLGACLLPGIGSILAIVFGHICLAKMGRQQVPQRGKWMAITGIVLGYSMLAILMIAGIVYLILTKGR